MNEKIKCLCLLPSKYPHLEKLIMKSVSTSMCTFLCHSFKIKI